MLLLQLRSQLLLVVGRSSSSVLLLPQATGREWESRGGGTRSPQSATFVKRQLMLRHKTLGPRDLICGAGWTEGVGEQDGDAGCWDRLLEQEATREGKERKASVQLVRQRCEARSVSERMNSRFTDSTQRLLLHEALAPTAVSHPNLDGKNQTSRRPAVPLPSHLFITPSASLSHISLSSCDPRRDSLPVFSHSPISPFPRYPHPSFEAIMTRCLAF